MEIKNQSDIIINGINLGGFTFATKSKRVFSKRKSYYLQFAEVTLKFIVIDSDNNCHRAVYRKLKDSQLDLLKAVIKDSENGSPLSARII
jgi:hypothetical protein